MPTSWRTGALIGAGLLAAVVFAVLALRSPQPPPTIAAPSEPTAAPTEVPLPQPEPFTVELGRVRDQPMDNGNLFGRKGDKRPKVVKRAARNAKAVLERYLNAAFVDPATRTTDAGLRALLTKPARDMLTPRDRRALGEGVLEIAGGDRQQAQARVIVAHEGPRVSGMTVRYRAAMRVFTADGARTRLRQQGVLVLFKTANGWRADMVDVRLNAPPPAPPEPSPPPSPSSPAPTDGGTS